MIINVTSVMCGGTDMFRNIQIYMGDAVPGDAVTKPGNESILRAILRCGRSNLHLACELYCQLVKQTHRCVNAENEVGQRGVCRCCRSCRSCRSYCCCFCYCCCCGSTSSGRIAILCSLRTETELRGVCLCLEFLEDRVPNSPFGN